MSTEDGECEWRKEVVTEKNIKKY
ncbi:hypothetical protein GWI33_012586, partial [Rhynchophorus ferrugineus]